MSLTHGSWRYSPGSGARHSDGRFLAISTRALIVISHPCALYTFPIQRMLDELHALPGDLRRIVIAAADRAQCGAGGGTVDAEDAAAVHNLMRAAIAEAAARC